MTSTVTVGVDFTSQCDMKVEKQAVRVRSGCVQGHWGSVRPVSDVRLSLTLLAAVKKHHHVSCKCLIFGFLDLEFTLNTVFICVCVFSSPTVLADLLEKVVAHLSSSATERFFPPPHYKGQYTSSNTLCVCLVWFVLDNWDKREITKGQSETDCHCSGTSVERLLFPPCYFLNY